MNAVEYFSNIRDRFIGSNNMFLRGEGQIAEASMVTWQQKVVQIRT